MLVVSVSPWLTWFHTVFLTQLIPHNTAHCPPQLPASPCQTEEKFSATERHNWNRKRILFWGLWSIALRLWRTLRSRVKPVLSCPCVRTSFPTALEGEMRNYLHALLRIKREGKWQWRACRLYVKHVKLMFSFPIWCCRILPWVDLNWRNVSFLYQLWEPLQRFSSLFFHSTSAVVLFSIKIIL